jgi:hypothetical protein
LGTAGLARAARLSGGVITRRDRQGRIIERLDSMKNFEARFLRAGYSSGEGAGMIGQIGGQGWGLGGGAAERLLSATHGGLGNAVGLYGLGAQFGGGTASAAGKYFGALQGMFGGRTGVDVTAASGLLGAGQAAMMSGNFMGGNGLGFLQTLLDAGMTGTAGGDMRRAAQVQAGMGLMGNKLAGGTDPLQQALNWSAALQAAPGAGVTAHRALAGMDLATRMDILRTGKVGGALADAGVTADMVRNYANTQTSTDLSRFVEDKKSGIGEAVDRFRGAGGLSYLKGMSGKDREREIQRLGFAYAQTTGASQDAAQGMFWNMASELGFLPRSRGPGARQSFSKDSLYGTALESQAGFVAGDARTLGEGEEEFKAGARGMGRNYAASEAARRQGQRSAAADRVEDAAGQVANALMGLVAALKQTSPKQGPFRAQPNGRPL